MAFINVVVKCTMNLKVLNPVVKCMELEARYRLKSSIFEESKIMPLYYEPIKASLSHA